MPKVSVLVPLYNVEKYVRRCVVSIQRQSLVDIEIIVVNDGTPDNSMAIVEELAKSDGRIKVLEHEKNMGLMWTRRTGYIAATGDYITFCDSDDYLPDNALEILYNEAIRTDADIVSGDYIYVTNDGREVYSRSKLQYGTTSPDVLKSLLRKEYTHNLCGKLFKRALLQDYVFQTYEHATNGEDGILFYQLLANTKNIVHVNTNVYYYVQNCLSSTQVRYNENSIRSICLLWKVTVNTIKNIPELEQELNRRLTNRLCVLYIQGYNKDARLGHYIKEYGLRRYISSYFIFRYIDLWLITKTFIRRLCNQLKNISNIHESCSHHFCEKMAGGYLTNHICR